MQAAELPYATLGDIFAPKFVPDPPDTVMALQVKSTALLERSVRLATTWSNGKHVCVRVFDIMSNANFVLIARQQTQRNIWLSITPF